MDLCVSRLGCAAGVCAATLAHVACSADEGAPLPPLTGRGGTSAGRSGGGNVDAGVRRSGAAPASVVDRFSGGHQSPGDALRAIVRIRRRAAFLGLAGLGAIAVGSLWLILAPKPPPADAATVDVPFEEVRTERTPGPPAAFGAGVEMMEEASVPGKILALLPASNGEATLVVEGARSARVVESARGEITPELLRAAPEVPLAGVYARSSPSGPLFVGGDGKVSCLDTNGKVKLLYGGGLFADRLIVDVAAARECEGYVTTRASKEGT